MFNNDYIMRAIEDLSYMLAKVIFNKDVTANEIIDEQGNFSESNFLYHQLLKKVDEGKINEAENLLFESIENNPSSEYLKVAIDFYVGLEKLSDETLNSNSFPREEILEGLLCINRIYKVNESILEDEL